MPTEQLSYSFDTIFAYDPVNNILVPRFNVKINGVYIAANTVINPVTNTGGVNLYSYIGKTIVGTWDATTSTLYIVGFA